MNKRKLVWTLTAVLLLVGAVGFYWNFFAEQSITISQSDLQSRIDAKISEPRLEVQLAGQVAND